MEDMMPKKVAAQKQHDVLKSKRNTIFVSLAAVFAIVAGANTYGPIIGASIPAVIYIGFLAWDLYGTVMPMKNLQVTWGVGKEKI